MEIRVVEGFERVVTPNRWPFFANNIKMDAWDVQRQLNQTVQESNNEILSKLSNILESCLSI